MTFPYAQFWYNDQMEAKKIPATINRRQFLLTAMAGTAGIVCATATANETNVFTPQQEQQIKELQRRLTDPGEIRRLNAVNNAPRHLLEEAIRRFNPALVGQNVMFGPRWLEVVGEGKPIPPQPFQQWRDRVDETCNAYLPAGVGRTRIFRICSDTKKHKTCP